MKHSPDQIKARLRSHLNSEVSTEPVPLTPDLVMSLRRRLPEEKREEAYILVDSKAYQAFLEIDSLLVDAFDSTTSLKEIEAGHLGVLYGMDVLTDAFYLERFLPSGRVYVMASDGTEGYGSATLP